MKILMLLEHDFPPDMRVENEILSLVKAGHKVVLAGFTKDKKGKIENWEGCKLYKKPVSRFIYKASVGALKFPFYFRYWRKFAEEIILKEKPDAIHVHDLPLARVGYELKQKYKLQFTLDLHENWPALLDLSEHTKTFMGRMLSNSEQWRVYEKQYCELADSVIVVIDEAKKRLQDLGIPSEKIHIVANYPELSHFENVSNVKQEKDQLVMFYAGGITKHRGLQYIIEALPAIRKKMPEVQLWLLGDGRFRGVLEQRVKELGLDSVVKFFGYVPYGTVLEKLAQSNIALIPHIKSDHTDNTIPHKLFQYMYAGIPVVASDCDPLKRILEETYSGWIYKWDSSDDFSQVILNFQQNYARYDSSKIKHIIEEKYAWQHAEQELIGLYSV